MRWRLCTPTYTHISDSRAGYGAWDGTHGHAREKKKKNYDRLRKFADDNIAGNNAAGTAHPAAGGIFAVALPER